MFLVAKWVNIRVILWTKVRPPLLVVSTRFVVVEWWPPRFVFSVSNSGDDANCGIIFTNISNYFFFGEFGYFCLFRNCLFTFLIGFSIDFFGFFGIFDRFSPFSSYVASLIIRILVKKKTQPHPKLNEIRPGSVNWNRFVSKKYFSLQQKFNFSWALGRFIGFRSILGQTASLIEPKRKSGKVAWLFPGAEYVCHTCVWICLRVCVWVYECAWCAAIFSAYTSIIHTQPLVKNEATAMRLSRHRSLPIIASQSEAASVWFKRARTFLSIGSLRCTSIQFFLSGSVFSSHKANSVNNNKFMGGKLFSAFRRFFPHLFFGLLIFKFFIKSVFFSLVLQHLS